MIVVGFGSYVQEEAGIRSMQLLIEYHNFINILMGMQIEEECIGRVFRDSSIHMAGWSRRT